MMKYKYLPYAIHFMYAKAHIQAKNDGDGHPHMRRTVDSSPRGTLGCRIILGSLRDAAGRSAALDPALSHNFCEGVRVRFALAHICKQQ
jgi:hypothetical protein